MNIKSLILYLDKLDPKTKVRIVFKDYDLWREFLPLSDKYKDKFFLFREKKDFIMNSNLIETKQNNISLKESLKNYLGKNQVPEEIKKILLEELK